MADRQSSAEELKELKDDLYALRCGFEWGSTLSSVFRRVTGTTPRTFRKTHGPA